MISVGSRSFAMRKRQVLFQSRKFQKWVWSVLFMEKLVRVEPKDSPLDPALASLIEVANIMCIFDCMILMGIL